MLPGPKSPNSAQRRRATGDTSRLGAAALRQAVTASLVSSSSSRSAAFALASSRLFSTDASGEAAGAGAGSQDDSFPKSSGKGSSRVLVSAAFFPLVFLPFSVSLLGGLGYSFFFVPALEEG